MSSTGVSFADLFTRWPWRPIPNCPGRFVLSPREFAGPPNDLAVDTTGSREFQTQAPDPVVVTPFEEGGLISYRKPDGGFLHTLNTAEGFRRKLEQLGIDLSGDPEI